MSKRFDNRTQQQFADDIYFGTAIEKYFWNQWVDRCSNRQDINLANPRDNGVANDGAFIASGNTSGSGDLPRKRAISASANRWPFSLL